MATTTTTAPPGPVYTDYPGAARLTTWSPKHLYRLGKAGAPIGMVRSGRSVRFHVPTLLRYLDSLAGATAAVDTAAAGGRAVAHSSSLQLAVAIRFVGPAVPNSSRLQESGTAGPTTRYGQSQTARVRPSGGCSGPA